MNAIARLLEWPAEPEETSPAALWDAIGIARAVHGTANADFRVSGVEIDSRDVMPGDLFVALGGESTDGHRFVESAFAKGAVAAMVSRPVDGPHVLVSHTSSALELLGEAARERTRARIVGVTGSVGKTGVKEALFASLDRASRGRSHRSVKSYNNHVGVPLSLARMPADARSAVFEMGMNHAGEIAALTRQVRPHIALVTTIAPAHIEMLGSEESIADAKAEIFEGLEPGGVAIIPADSPHFSRLETAARKHASRVIGFGKSDHADVRLLDVVGAPGGGSLVTAEFRSEPGGLRRVCYTVAAPGEHWVINSLAVMAAVHASGADLGSAGLALAEMEGLAGRGAIREVPAGEGTALVIDESYNANPASMRATLAQLGRMDARRRLAVLGSMKELGRHGPGFHAALAEPVVAAGVDFVVLVGDEMTALADKLGKSDAGSLGKRVAFAHCASVEDAERALREYGIAAGDAILVKGSNSMGLGALVASLAGSKR